MGKKKKRKRKKEEVRELVTEKLSKNRFDGVEKDPEFAAEDRQKTYSVEWNKSHRISYRRPPRTDPMDWKKLHGYDLSLYLQKTSQDQNRRNARTPRNQLQKNFKNRLDGVEEFHRNSYRRSSRDRHDGDDFFYGLSYRRL